MWQVWRWARLSNEGSIDNARVAAVACSRRLAERLEIELFLDRLQVAPEPARRPRRRA